MSLAGEMNGGAQGSKGLGRGRLGFQVGDQGPLDFRALSFAILPFPGNVGNGRQDRQAEETLGGFTILDGVVEIFEEKGQAAAEHGADDQAEEQVLFLVRLDRPIGGNGGIDDVDTAEGGGLGDARLLVLLQQEGVDIAVDRGQPGQPGQLLLGGGQLLDLGLVALQLAIEILDLAAEGGLHRAVTGQELALHLGDAVAQGLHLGMGLAVVDEQPLALDLQAGKVAGQPGDHRIIEQRTGGINGLVGQGVVQGLDGELGLALAQQREVLGLFGFCDLGNERLGLGVEAHHPARRLVVFQVFLRLVKLAPDVVQLGLDEGHRLAGLFGLGGDAPLQVDGRQGVDDVPGPPWIGVLAGDADDVGTLPHLGSPDSSPQALDGLVEGEQGEAEVVAGLALQFIEKQGQPPNFQPAADLPLADDLALAVGDLEIPVTGQGDPVLRFLSSGLEFEHPGSGSRCRLVDGPVEVQPPHYLLGVGAALENLDLGFDGILPAETEVPQEIPPLELLILDVQGGSGLENGAPQQGPGDDRGHHDQENDQGRPAAPGEDIEVVLKMDLLGLGQRGR